MGIPRRARLRSLAVLRVSCTALEHICYRTKRRGKCRPPIASLRAWTTPASARARLPQGLGTGVLRADQQRRSFGRVPEVRVDGRHHSRLRTRSCGGPGHEGREKTRQGQERRREPLRPRRQGHDHRRGPLNVDLNDYTPTDGKWESFTTGITYDGKDADKRLGIVSLVSRRLHSAAAVGVCVARLYPRRRHFGLPR